MLSVGAMFFEGQTWIVSASDCFLGTFASFCFMMFLTKEELTPMLVHFRKIFNCKVSLNVPLNCREKTLNIVVIK